MNAVEHARLRVDVDLMRRQTAALRQSRWLTPAESGEPCAFPVGPPGVDCLRCGNNHHPVRAGPMK